MIACFTGIVLGTTTGRMGDLQQLPRWRLQLAVSYNTVSAGLKQTHHSTLARLIKYRQVIFFFLLLVLLSVRLKKEQVCESSGFTFTS